MLVYLHFDLTILIDYYQIFIVILKQGIYSVSRELFVNKKGWVPLGERERFRLHHPVQNFSKDVRTGASHQRPIRH